MNILRVWLAATLLACTPALADESAGPLYVPYQPSGIYALGETVGWHVTLPWNSPAASYVVRKNNLGEIGRGKITPGYPTKIEATLDEPGMVFVEVTENTPGAKPRALGAAVSPENHSRCQKRCQFRPAGFGRRPSPPFLPSRSSAAASWLRDATD